MPNNNESNNRTVNRNRRHNLLNVSHATNNNENSTDELQLHNHYRRIKGKSINIKKSTLTTSVSEFMNDVITHVNPNSKNEQILWSKIQKCIIGKYTKKSTIAVIIGLSKGYQIFIFDNGYFEEIISVRSAPLKNGHLLPLLLEENDKLTDQRPIFASIFDPSDKINFLSLRTGKLVNNLKFDVPLLEVDSSISCLFVALVGFIALYNHEDLSERRRINIPGNTPIFSITANLLAFADDKYDQKKQSCGFLGDNKYLVNNHVVTTAKTITKTMSSIGGSLVSTLNITNQKNEVGKGIEMKLGVITVLNIEKTQVYAKGECSVDYLAHFCTYNAVGHIKFSQGGQMILTGSNDSTIFNIFLIHFHSNNSSLSSIQHIYSLVRGNSVAKVSGSTFSHDNRWVAISTNHGTTHLFTINPYGGNVNTRTHHGKFMNKESRFEKSVGIKFQYHSSARKMSGVGTRGCRTHPGTWNSTILQTVLNRHTSTVCDTNPITLTSTILAKQRIFSSEQLRAWASDNAPTLNSSGNNMTNHNNTGINNELSMKRSVVFANSLNTKQEYDRVNEFLLMLEGDGILTQFRTVVSENRSKNKGSHAYIKETDGENINRKSDLKKSPDDGIANTNTPFKTKLTQITKWELTRNNGTLDFEAINPPLNHDNAILRLYSKESKKPLNHSWLPFLEVISYMGPHRRMWLGPQFSFNMHSTKKKLPILEDENIGQQVNGIEKRFPVHVQSEPVDLVHRTPVTLAKIICGSWSSELDIKPIGAGSLKDKIDDAMKESCKHHHL